MSTIRFDGETVRLLDGESVLDGLLRAGIAAPHSCKAGVCGSCLLRAVSGAVPAKAQAGLKETWKSRGYFLACVCRPETDLEVSRAGDGVRFGASIGALDALGASVLRVRLQTDSPVDFRAGQYLTLLRADGLARSYSIASLPEEGFLELHVRVLPGGQMSGWLAAQARPGDRVEVLGPSGECFYVADDAEKPLILAGVGTGLAPLYGIVRDALANGHRGPIRLFHGALEFSRLYLMDELRALAAANPNFEYVPVVRDGAPDGLAECGSLDEVILRRLPALAGWRAYVCGDPPIVSALKRRLFLAGVASRDIHSDAFLPAA